MYAEFVKLAEYIQLGSLVSPDKARSFLQDPPERCPACILYLAVRSLYGESFLDWEPETLWYTLQNEGITLSDASQNKLQAAITLQSVPSFYWDNIVFQNTVQALNDVGFNAESIQEPDVVHMCWAVNEAGIIRKLDPDGNDIPDFDEDVQMFVGVVLRRAAFVLAPEQLEFAQEFLEKQYSTDAKELTDAVKAKWESLDKEALQEVDFPEDPLGIQLAKLAGCELFIRERSKEMALCLWQLQN